MKATKHGLGLTKRFSLNLFDHYREAQTKLHDMRYLFWECTLRCNISCLHCGSDCRKKTGQDDMRLDDFLGVLDKLAQNYDPNRIMVVITGGEPLMREDLEECGREIYKRGFPWGLVTNGYLMTPDRLDRLVECGLHSLTISLDGLEESHNWLRGKSDSFKKAFTAITHAASIPNLVFDVVTCVNQRNFEELEDFKCLLIGQGVKAWRLFTIFPKGRAHDNDLLDLPGSVFKKLMEFIKKTRKQGMINAQYGCEGFLGGYEKEVRDTYFFCRAGIHISSVLADGSISACPSLRGDYIQGNIYRDNIIDVWENRYRIMRDRSWTKRGKCASCEVYTWCKGNGLHLIDQQSGNVLKCQYELLQV